ncbi:hypothetical protein A8F94_19645 [Bacillus sp. FJAT-27225]|nr:hypothetical protein A8F94_19645 [Bacillus sp. FJAT-27225]
MNPPHLFELGCCPSDCELSDIAVIKSNKFLIPGDKYLIQGDKLLIQGDIFVIQGDKITNHKFNTKM